MHLQEQHPGTNRGVGQGGYVPERLGLGIGERPGSGVEDSNGAKNEAGFINNRAPGVKAKMGIFANERIEEKAAIFGKVRDHQGKVGSKDRVGAESDLSVQLGNVEADLGLEPEAVGIHQRDDRDRRLKRVTGQPGEGVEVELRRRVEDLVRPNDSKALLLVIGRGAGRGGVHWSCRSVRVMLRQETRTDFQGGNTLGIGYRWGNVRKRQGMRAGKSVFVNNITT